MLTSLSTEIDQFISSRFDDLECSAPGVDIQFDHESRSPYDFGQTRSIARNYRCAESHGLDDRSAEAFIFTREDECSGHPDQTVAIGVRYATETTYEQITLRSRYSLLYAFLHCTNATHENESHALVGPVLLLNIE